MSAAPTVTRDSDGARYVSTVHPVDLPAAVLKIVTRRKSGRTETSALVAFTNNGLVSHRLRRDFYRVELVSIYHRASDKALIDQHNLVLEKLASIQAAAVAHYAPAVTVRKGDGFTAYTLNPAGGV